MIHEANVQSYLLAHSNLTASVVCNCGATFNVELIGGRDSQLIQSITEGLDYADPLAEAFCPYRRIEKLEAVIERLRYEAMPVGYV